MGGKRKPDARRDLLFDVSHSHPPRYRARIKGGGYRRTTVSLPDVLYEGMIVHLKTRPGLTVSAFVSEVVAAALDDVAPKANEE